MRSAQVLIQSAIPPARQSARRARRYRSTLVTSRAGSCAVRNVNKSLNATRLGPNPTTPDIQNAEVVRIIMRPLTEHEVCGTGCAGFGTQNEPQRPAGWVR